MMKQMISDLEKRIDTLNKLKYGNDYAEQFAEIKRLAGQANYQRQKARKAARQERQFDLMTGTQYVIGITFYEHLHKKFGRRYDSIELEGWNNFYTIFQGYLHNNVGIKKMTVHVDDVKFQTVNFNDNEENSIDVDFQIVNGDIYLF